MPRTVVMWALLCLTPAALFGADPATKPATRPATRAAPFAAEIAAFEAADRDHPPPSGGILFLGSSSIRRWTTLAKDFPGLPVVNRGFGGSTIPDSIRYADRIVLPYRPRAIVFYAGDNDLAQKRTPEQVLADSKEFARLVQQSLPETRVIYLATKPSPSRWKLADTQRHTNDLIRAFTDSDPRLEFIDTFTPLLGPDGQPREELYAKDQLHLNEKGYAIWTRLIAPHLVDPSTRPTATTPRRGEAETRATGH